MVITLSKRRTSQWFAYDGCDSGNIAGDYRFLISGQTNRWPVSFKEDA